MSKLENIKVGCGVSACFLKDTELVKETIFHELSFHFLFQIQLLSSTRKPKVFLLTSPRKPSAMGFGRKALKISVLQNAWGSKSAGILGRSREQWLSSFGAFLCPDQLGLEQTRC